MKQRMSPRSVAKQYFNSEETERRKLSPPEKTRRKNSLQRVVPCRCNKTFLVITLGVALICAVLGSQICETLGLIAPQWSLCSWKGSDSRDDSLHLWHALQQGKQLHRSTNSSTSSVLIAFTSDIHGHTERKCRNSICYPGAPSIESAMQTIRKSSPNVILLDIGDALFGSATVNATSIALTMNRLNYTAMAVGNHDLEIGRGRLQSFSATANFPLLSSNIDGCSEFIDKFKRIKLPGSDHLCLVGVTTSQVNPLINVTVNPEESVLAHLKKLKFEDKTCQRIVLMSHSGLGVDKKLAQHADAVNVIDVILGGHSHVLSGTDEPPESPEFGSLLERESFPMLTENSMIPIAHTGAYGRYLGLIQLEWNADNEKTNVVGNLLPLDEHHGVHADKVMEEYVVKVLPSDATSVRAIKLDMELDKSIPKTVVCGFRCRQGECLLGNLVTDAMRSCVLNGPCKVAAGNEMPVLAMLESGTLRDCVGDDGDLSAVLPWPNTIELLQLSGAVVSEMVANGVKSGHQLLGGGFLQVSGLRYQYRKDASIVNVGAVTSPLAPTTTKTGKHKVVMKKEANPRCPAQQEQLALNNETMYLVAVTDWLANGGDGYGSYVATTKSKVSTNVTLHEALLHYDNAEVKLEGRSCSMNSGSARRTTWKAASGFVGGYVAFFASYPLYTLFVRKSTHSGSGDSKRRLFDGVLVGSLATATCQFLYFLVYHINEDSWSTAFRSWSGALSTTVLTNPLWVVVTRLQTAGARTSWAQISFEIYKQRGFCGFWDGISMNLVMCVFPVVRQIMYEALLLQNLPVAAAGGAAACVATIVTLPIQVARVRLQQGMSLAHVMTKWNCWDGLVFKLLHSAVSSSVLFFVKANLDDLVLLMAVSD